MRVGLIRNFAGAGCLAAVAAVAPSAQAASVTADLTCILNGLNGHACVAGSSFGTVKLEELINDDIKITVDLLNSGLKFKDLMLNFGGAAGSLSSTDGQVVLSPNGFSIAPYTGLFDVGESADNAKGWNGDSGYMTTIAGGAGAPLALSDFMVFDSGGKVMVALHIQSIGVNGCSGSDNGTTNCVPGMTGSGSLKIGGTFTPDDDLPPVPEPSTVLLMGGSLLALSYFRKKRNG